MLSKIMVFVLCVLCLGQSVMAFGEVPNNPPVEHSGYDGYMQFTVADPIKGKTVAIRAYFNEKLLFWPYSTSGETVSVIEEKNHSGLMLKSIENVIEGKRGLVNVKVISKSWKPLNFIAFFDDESFWYEKFESKE